MSVFPRFIWGCSFLKYKYIAWYLSCSVISVYNKILLFWCNYISLKVTVTLPLCWQLKCSLTSDRNVSDHWLTCFDVHAGCMYWQTVLHLSSKSSLPEIAFKMFSFSLHPQSSFTGLFSACILVISLPSLLPSHIHSCRILAYIHPTNIISFVISSILIMVSCLVYLFPFIMLVIVEQSLRSSDT